MPVSLSPQTIYVAVLAIGLVAAQLYYRPDVDTEWRTRLRWVFLAGALLVVVGTVGRIVTVLGGTS